MGGGFGGCTINLVQKGKEKAFEEALIAKYEKRHAGKKLPVFYVRAGSGAHGVVLDKA